MERELLGDLLKWKDSAKRKPLLLVGARQVGKTWLLKHFAKNYYDNSVYIVFEKNPTMKTLFSLDYDVGRIIDGLEIYTGRKIEPAKTLLIFDEIQEVPDALAALKYFAENAPEYHIVCAGSLLGVSMHEGYSFPVGKVETLRLYPLSFSEFLTATGNQALAKLIATRDFAMIQAFKNRYEDMLRKYFYVGGMPEVVDAYIESGDYTKVRVLQNEIIGNYERDFSKHAPKGILRSITMLWETIASQLAKENKKFIYSAIKSGARASDYEEALLWLQNYGVVEIVHRVTQANTPLKAYADLRAFKLFVLDVGLLSAMSNLRAETLLEGDAMFVEFKGSLTEQYVLQQLVANGIAAYYWTNKSGTSEVDFLIYSSRGALPIEVKAGVNLKAKSLFVYRDKFHPVNMLRTSMADYKDVDGLVDMPLYAISALE
ncbi:MAG: ATP-binding protein [Clostridiales Family XIII bacterium]|nr:ATP-binding protein [Clostridiales Family XIII bacterium]